MRRIPLWIGAALVLAAPLGADQIEVPPYTAVPPCIDLAGGPTVGTVVAMNGPVTISAPGCAPVAAECGMALHAGQQLGTGAGAQAALAAGSQYVQVAGDSQVTIAATDTGATRVVVDRGSARVIDVGTASGPATDAEVATPALETRDPGADVVASASEKGSSICSYADPIEVRRGGATSSVAAGDCATTPGFTPIAGPIGDATGATVAAIPISIGGVGHCGVAVGDPGPPQVASGPPGSTVPGPPPVIPPPYCVGGSCAPPPPPPPCCPGGIVEQPVIFEPPPD